MRKPVLMTGITGQAGSYLANLPLAKANEVRCLKGRSSSFNILTGLITSTSILTQAPRRSFCTTVISPASPASSGKCKKSSPRRSTIWLLGADAAVIITEWNVLRALDLPRVRALMNSPVVVHLRNVCDPEEMTCRGFACTCVGRGMLGWRQ
jgi:hypothetical protein